MITLYAFSALAVPLIALRIFARRRNDKRTIAERIVCLTFRIAHWWYCLACASDRALVEFRRQKTAIVPQPECLEVR